MTAYPCCQASGRTVCPQHAQQAQLDAEEAEHRAVARDLARGVASGATRLA